MESLYTLVWFAILIPVLIWIFSILNEKSEIQLIVAFISILIWGLSYEIFWTSNFSNSLIIWWLIIWFIWFKKISKQIRF